MHRAMVDCFRKKVKFSIQEESEVKFCGERRMLLSRILLVMTTRKMIKKQYAGYLAYVIDTKKE